MGWMEMEPLPAVPAQSGTVFLAPHGAGDSTLEAVSHCHICILQPLAQQHIMMTHLVFCNYTSSFNL